MIHSLADYKGDKESKNISMPINKPKKYQNHKSLGKYPMPKKNNINSEKKKFSSF